MLKLSNRPAAPDRMGELLLAWLPIAVLIGLSWLVLWRQGFYLVDDSYISFRYAENLARGQGLVWNPGEPVEGYTNLLWVLLLAPFARLGMNLTIPSAVLGTLASCLTLEVVRRVSQRSFPSHGLMVRALPALLLATHPCFVYWTTSGMETALFCLLVVLALHLLVRGRDCRRCDLWAGLALAASCLTRPEGLLVAFLGCLVELACRRGDWLGRLRPLLVPGGLALVAVGGQLAFRQWYYGDLLPNTFYAKVIVGELTVLRGTYHLLSFLLAGGYYAVLGLFALIGHRKRSASPYIVHGAVLFITYVSYLLFIGGDHPAWNRFYVPLLPLMFVALADLCVRLGNRVALHRRWSAARVQVATGLAVLVVCAPLALSWPHAEPRLAEPNHTGGDVVKALVQSFYERQVPAGSYLAADAVGMVGYYTRLRILDTYGLNDRHIARTKTAADPHAMFAHDKHDWLYVASQLPDYVQTCLATADMHFPGYDVCWPSYILKRCTIYRRNFPLPPGQRALGMPPGVTRTVSLPPPCAVPPPEVALPLGFRLPPEK